MRSILGSFLFLFSTMALAQVEFDHVEFKEEGTIAPNGVEYCLTVLHKNELRIPEYFDHLPCEMVKTVLSEYNYTNRPHASYGNFSNLIVLSSAEFKVEGDFFTYMSEEFRRVSGKKKWVDLLTAHASVIAPALAELQIPKMNNKYGNLTSWAFGRSFDKIPAFLDLIVSELNAQKPAEAYSLRKLKNSEVSIPVRCAAQAFELKRGEKTMIMGVCASSEPFFLIQ